MEKKNTKSKEKLSKIFSKIEELLFETTFKLDSWEAKFKEIRGHLKPVKHVTNT